MRRFGPPDDSAHRFFPGAGCWTNVNRHPPNDTREVFTYASAHAHPGMVTCIDDGHAHAEQYFAVTREPRDVLYDLTAVCATHACGNGTRLDEWSIVRLGQEVPDTLGMQALAVVPAVFEGDAFEYLRADDLHLRFLWVVPLFPSEAALRERAGAEALQRLLFVKGVDLADLHRRPVA